MINWLSRVKKRLKIDLNENYGGMMASYNFFIKGELIDLNNYTKANRKNKYYANKIKQDTEDYIIWHIKEQLKDLKITKQVEINYNWICKDKKKDKDNISFSKKFIQDAMVKSGLLKNDGWNDIAGFSDKFEIDKENPRIEIELVEVENE